jgi:O-antigen ligase
MTRLVVRVPLPRLGWTALIRAGAAARASIPFLIWGVVAVMLGLIIGLAAVVLPPTGAFGIVGIASLVLLWSLPDLPAVPDKMIWRLMLLVLIVDLCVPEYYAVQVLGLPWISARRLVTAPLIVIFAITVSVSPSARSRLSAVLRDSPIIAVCAIGFLVMGFLSILTSVEPSTSVSAFVNMIFSWYVPFLVIIYAVRSDEDVLPLLRALGWCAIFISCAGAVEFVLHRNLFIAIMPGWLSSSLAANNPSFEYLLNYAAFRNGSYRAASAYNVSLSLGEFEAMMLPVAYFLALHSTKLRDTLFGVLLVVACWVGIFCSGARGGYQSAIVATAAFSALWGVRLALVDRRSLAPALLAVLYVSAVAMVIGVLAFSTTIHNRVIGGGTEQYSNQARWEQWDLAKPKIANNPITGHGLGLAPLVVGYHLDTHGTLDSFVITTLVETGVPGFVFFFGMVFATVARGMRQYLFSPSRSGLLAGALGCSLFAFGAYRFALSQVENNTLAFVMAGLVLVLSHLRNVSNGDTYVR